MHLPVLEAGLDDYRQLLELNVVSVLGAMQQAVPVMQAGGGGSIVNISSGTTLRLFPGLAPYSSTKHAPTQQPLRVGRNAAMPAPHL
nr:SDR family oxidoreductase [Deinococcus sp. Leaf326]